MKRNLFVSILAVLCAVALLAGCAAKEPASESAAKPAEEPAPLPVSTVEPSEETPSDDSGITVEPMSATSDDQGKTEAEAEALSTLDPVDEVKKLSGTVVEKLGNELIVTDAKGNSIVFTLTYIQDTEAKQGDEVTVSYVGDVLDCPEATEITIDKVLVVPQINGTVVRIFDSQIFVEISSSDVFGFYTTTETQVTGVSQLALDDYVTVYYSGSLEEAPIASKIDVTTPAKDRSRTDSGTGGSSEDDLTNKHLSGQVTELSSKSITILTSKNRSWTFKRSSSTKITGKNLEVGAKVRITYDGYASEHPLAKQIKVTAGPDPTPKTYKTSGVVTAYGGMNLQLDHNRDFDVVYAKNSGTGNHQVGDYATVTYYVEGGRNYATRVVWEMKCG